MLFEKSAECYAVVIGELNDPARLLVVELDLGHREHFSDVRYHQSTDFVTRKVATFVDGVPNDLVEKLVMAEELSALPLELFRVESAAFFGCGQLIELLVNFSR